MLKIKKAIDLIFDVDENLTLENRLFLSAIIVGILTSTIGALVNLIFLTSFIAVIIPLLLSAFLFFLYYLVRFKRIIEPIKIPIIILAQVGISIIWVFNGGINGSNVMPGLVILILSLIIVSNRNKKNILLLFLILNAIVYFIQLYKPELITNYTSETERWIDSIITLGYTSFFMFLIIQFLHKNYTLEKQKSEEGEKKYRLSEANLVEAQKIAHIGSWEWDMVSNGMIWSKEMYRVFDIKEEEFDGKPSTLLKVIHPDDILLFAKSMNSNLPNGISTTLEYRVIHKDGSVHNLYAEGRVECNIDGSPFRSVGTVQDITYLKRVEEEKRKVNNWLRTLSEAIEQSQVTTVITDLSGSIEFVNPKFTETTGYTFNEAIGKNPRILKSDDKTESEYKELWDTILSGKSWHGIFQNKRKSGELYWESAIISPVKDEYGTITHFLAVKEEITSRIKTEQEIKDQNKMLEKLNSEKDKFFSIIAHDLRTPFASFVGLADLMANGNSQFSVEEYHQFALSLHKTAVSTFNLLENLLEWSQLQRGSGSFDPKTIALNEFFDHCDESTIEMAHKKSIYFDIVSPQGLTVIADNNMLRSILRNLILNAIKFTTKGGSIKVEAKMDKSGFVLFSVQDSGIGINAELIENLFRIDTNVSRPGTDGEPSTGLGLILCKEFVEKHRGRIWVESEVDKGSTFYFTIPAAKS